MNKERLMELFVLFVKQKVTINMLKSVVAMKAKLRNMSEDSTIRIQILQKSKRTSKLSKKEKLINFLNKMKLI